MMELLLEYCSQRYEFRSTSCQMKLLLVQEAIVASEENENVACTVSFDA